MPEGPSIIILKEEVQQFKGKTIRAVAGNSKIDQQRMVNKTIIDFKSWGKQFLICFDTFTLRVHFLLFGTYRINEKRESPLRLGFSFENGELNFYTSSLRFIEEELDTVYDWEADVLSDQWNAKKAIKKLESNPNAAVTDVLLDQQVFAGVGNIIKNEVLYRIKVHPESIAGNLPIDKLTDLVYEARTYSLDFLEWKKEFVLRKRWLVYNKKECLRCHLPIIRQQLGKNKRRTFFCNNCQILY